MRRKEREVAEFEEIIEILKKCDTCRIAFFDEGYPYIVPLNFGFGFEDEKLVLYFHGAKTGKKMALMESCNKVGFEADCCHNLISGELACDYTMEYESVCGNGEITLLNESQKRFALQQLMKQYSEQPFTHFDEKILDATAVFKLTVNTITAKRLKH